MESADYHTENEFPTRGDNLHYPPTRRAKTVLLYQTFYRPNKRQNRRTGPELFRCLAAAFIQ